MGSLWVVVHVLYVSDVDAKRFLALCTVPTFLLLLYTRLLLLWLQLHQFHGIQNPSSSNFLLCLWSLLLACKGSSCKRTWKWNIISPIVSTTQQFDHGSIFPAPQAGTWLDVDLSRLLRCKRCSSTIRRILNMTGRCDRLASGTEGIKLGVVNMLSK
jgi:hypothetical protein